MARCSWLSRAARRALTPSGASTISAMSMPPSAAGASRTATPRSTSLASDFARSTIGSIVTTRTSACRVTSVGRGVGVITAVIRGSHDRLGARTLDEEGAMAHGLDGEEDAIEHRREQGEGERLGRRQRRARRRSREVRQHEREHRQGHDHREIGHGALQVVVLLMVSQTAQQQREADHPVQDDHQEREHGVAPQGRRGLGPQHHRRDQRDLDGDDGDGQDERAQGLSQELGQVVGPLDDAKRAPRDRPEEPREQQRGARPRRARRARRHRTGGRRRPFPRRSASARR